MSIIDRRSFTIGMALGGIGLWGAEPARSEPATAVGSLKLSQGPQLSTRGAAIALTWSPDGSNLAAASGYGEYLIVWDQDGSVVIRIKRIGGGPVTKNSLAFVDGSSGLLFPPPQTADPRICLDIWGVATGNILRSIDGPAPNIDDYARNRADIFAVSSDQRFAAAAPTVGGTVAIYETKHWERTASLKLDNGVSSIGFFPDGRRFAVGALIKGHLTVVDSTSGQVLADFAPYASKFAEIGIGTVAVSPDAEFIVTGIGPVAIHGEYINTAEGTTWDQAAPPAISLWRLRDGSHVAGLRDVQRPIRQAVWDARGRFVAFVDNAATLYLWETPTTNGRVTRISLSGPTMSLAVNQRGDRLAVSNDEGVAIYQIH